MIISHKHRFIFIKTRKTAGTSIELALSKICGEDAIITPVTPEDEKLRQSMDGLSPRNYHIPLAKYRPIDFALSVYERRLRQFHGHVPAEYVKRYIDKDVWDSYFKFCFERNPYDKVISWYFWTQRNSKPMKISSFLRTEKFMKRIMAREQYCINGNNVMNHIYRFENLNDAVINISERLGLSETLELPHAKGSVRPNKSSYRDLFNADDKALVDELFKYELVQFDYQW